MGRHSACTAEEWAWLEERYPSTPVKPLLNAFEREFGRSLSLGTVYDHMARRGIRRDVGRIEWTPELVGALREAVPGRSSKEAMAEFEALMGISLTPGQLSSAKNSFGVRSGVNSSRFEPGHVPANKGRTWDEMGISAEAQARMRKGQFKRGEVRNRPDGWIKPIGFERIGKDGYVEVKVRDSCESGIQPKEPGGFNRNYRMKHHVEWERANGRPVPEGCVIAFADGDRRNFDPANLVAVPRGLWATMQRGGIPYWDAASLETAMLAARLKQGIAEAERHPRQCKRCGATFEPRFARQRTCDRCLGRDSPN